MSKSVLVINTPKYCALCVYACIDAITKEVK